MNNALNVPGTVLLLGGTSEIGLAIVDRLVTAGARHVVLAGRDAAALDAVGARLGAEAKVSTVAYDATDTRGHTGLMERITEQSGDIDLAVCAVGVLGDQRAMIDDPHLAAQVMEHTYVGPAATLLAVAACMRRQGHGRIVVLSSVAGERVRAANFIYGSAKAGLDGFALGLGATLDATGVDVTIVRPGFVRTRMTAHLDDRPFATTADAVADATVRALRRGDEQVWAPGVLRWVMAAVRLLPRPLFRRVSA